MEFNIKLQELRKGKGLTQEELAQALFVSRTAISKWESGRGYPNIDSLKAIAKFFSVSIDELLSGDELLTVAKEDNIRNKRQFSSLAFGLIDLCTALLFFLPFFAGKSENVIREVSLLELNSNALYLRIVYYVLIVFIILWGVMNLALQNCTFNLWIKSKNTVSLILNASLTLVFIISSQPYAAVFMFVFLIIKILLLLKR